MYPLCKTFKVKVVWQCGDCGIVYDTKNECDICHNSSEKSYRCIECNRLYSSYELAMECKAPKE
jgi:hypothetical protein